MNINDVESYNDEPIEDLLEFIFKEQTELMHKYHQIEKANGLLVTEDIPVNLHDAKGQQRLKDFAWRFMEEVGEALESHHYLKDVAHTKEELADALHFLVEMAILSGIEYKEVYLKGWNFEDTWETVTLEPGYTIKDPLTRIVVSMGQACNCLKNKPWKQTHMLTNEEKYKDHLIEVFHGLFCLCDDHGIRSEKELFDLYFRKAQVNKFRQESKY